jgi:hypothetical protein
MVLELFHWSFESSISHWYLLLKIILNVVIIIYLQVNYLYLLNINLAGCTAIDSIICGPLHRRPRSKTFLRIFIQFAIFTGKCEEPVVSYLAFELL